MLLICFRKALIKNFLNYLLTCIETLQGEALFEMV